MISLTSSGLAYSVIASEDFMKIDTLYDGMLLYYSTKFKMNIIAADKLAKTHVKFPIDIDGTVEQIKALEVPCQFFLADR